MHMQAALVVQWKVLEDYCKLQTDMINYMIDFTKVHSTPLTPSYGDVPGT